MYSDVMPFKKRLTEDTEKVSGRVVKGVFVRFRNSISPRDKVIDHLSAALAVWANLRPEVKRALMDAMERDPDADLVVELLDSLGLDAAKVVREAEARYQVHKRTPSRKTAEAG